MSRAKFYRLTSATIRGLALRLVGVETEDYLDGIEAVARELAKAFAAHNSKFDPERFLRDCGL